MISYKKFKVLRYEDEINHVTIKLFPDPYLILYIQDVL